MTFCEHAPQQTRRRRPLTDAGTMTVELVLLTPLLFALLAFPLWAPDDELLAAIARKLFNDRQLAVPDAVIERMEAHYREMNEGVLIRLFRLFLAIVLWTFFGTLLALLS